MATFDRFKQIFAGGHAERRAEARSGLPKGIHVLVVDDSPTICAVLDKMLSQDGHVVTRAMSGEEAIARASDELPDLIFLDIVMPGMNGFAALRALRREPLTHDIPIVMISGNLQATEQFYVQRFGADDFMKKPFGRGEVFARIQDLLKKGRLTLRQRDGEASGIQTSTPPPNDPMAHDAVPDIAMPDPQDQPT